MLFTASTYSHILNFHLPYLRWFQEQGWTVHAACGGAPAAVPWTDGTLDLPFEKSMGSPDNFRAAGMLRRKIQEEGYALISTHTSLAAFFTRLALMGLRERPIVANMVHGYLFDEATPPLKRRILLAAEQLAAPQTDLLLTMNQWDFAAANRYRLGQRVVHIPGVGVDFSRLDQDKEAAGALREELAIPEDGLGLFYAAEFSKRKSQEVLLRAMAQLPEEIMLVLAGDGVLRPACQELARELGLTGRVLFPGHLRDVARWYAMADAVISSSRIEGLPFNIMEAMYAGRPIVASAVKGHVDLIADGVTGLLYPYGDADACARQVVRLWESEPLRRQLAEQAQAAAAQYALERVFPAVTGQYASLFPVPV